MNHQPKEIKIQDTDSNFEREKLTRPFGFKGGYLTELWQTIVGLESSSGSKSYGLATQSVLYGDADLFASHSESSGNSLMYILTEKALQLTKRTPFGDPVALQDKIIPTLMEEGRELTKKKNLNKNFLYNALVSVDNAAWLAYASEHNIHNFTSMIPSEYRDALAVKNDRIAIMYQVPYGMPLNEVEEAVDTGYFVIKIKTGQAGDEAEMLEKDIQRFTEIHELLKNKRTEQTPDGKLIYTLDANGRYRKKESIERFVDHAKKLGALDQILVYEEPFHESNEVNVADLGLRIAADESIHDESDAIKKLDQGYSAFVLKGIAKTLSQSLKMAKLAHERNVPCLCADLTVNPILVNWHKNLAAHLPPFPGLEKMGMMETNGDMNYINWQQMFEAQPYADASWNERKQGVFQLNDDFYDKSGGIFQPMPHYENMLTLNMK
ncbi:hypothetical protein OKW21_002398 [Catalinimonas alkaloidigena]|uniref:enolase C-terminal domain-like protein n=1 Tax=Catalinimonas alkaloidigena TaxID=1075417 RepID=UPI0024053BC5|nr:enolase C-terminal domain-like protein [Catalinimonas alkaloidigena]MDF9797135.1 hypothetical protein [Catalinimonas alkaloidigena]